MSNPSKRASILRRLVLMTWLTAASPRVAQVGPPQLEEGALFFVFRSARTTDATLGEALKAWSSLTSAQMRKFAAKQRDELHAREE